METVVPGLFASAPDALPFDHTLEIRSFLVRRDAGNLLLYRGDAVEQESESLTALGGVSRQYLNHRHEASPSRIAHAPIGRAMSPNPPPPFPASSPPPPPPPTTIAAGTSVTPSRSIASP